MEPWEWVGWVAFVLVWPMILYPMWWRHLLNHREARRTLPPLAAELGLLYRSAQAPKQIGTLDGTYQGYKVVIDADHPTKIRIDLKHMVDVHLQTTDSLFFRLTNRPPKGWVQLSFGSFKLNWFFAIRWAKPAVAERLRAAASRGDRTQPNGQGYRTPGQAPKDDLAHAIDLLRDFGRRFGGKLVEFKVFVNRVECSPARGTSDSAIDSITARQVRELLPPLIELARALDATAEGK